MIALLMLMALAGQEGNGGDGIKCGSTVTLFDYEEATYRHNLEIDLGPEAFADGRVRFVLRRLAKVSPLRAEMYSRWYESFWDETQKVLGRKLIDVPDTGHGHIPKDCELVQIATQADPIFHDDKRYLLDSELYWWMSSVHQAGLILHELVLREARMSGHQNSIRARYFNSLISSTVMNGISREEFRRRMLPARLDDIDFGPPLP